MLCLLFFSDCTLKTLLESSSGPDPNPRGLDPGLNFREPTGPTVFGVEGVELSWCRAYDLAISLPVMLIPVLTDDDDA